MYALFILAVVSSLLNLPVISSLKSRISDMTVFKVEISLVRPSNSDLTSVASSVANIVCEVWKFSFNFSSFGHPGESDGTVAAAACL